MFADVMDVVSSEARSGLPSEVLYVDDLVLGHKQWSNLADVWLMVGSSGGKMIVNSGKWPCSVCEKGIQANSVQCTVCKKLIHRRCSGVRSDLSRVVDGFWCRRCNGTIQEVDLAEDLMVDGET